MAKGRGKRRRAAQTGAAAAATATAVEQQQVERHEVATAERPSVPTSYIRELGGEAATTRAAPEPATDEPDHAPHIDDVAGRDTLESPPPAPTPDTPETSSPPAPTPTAPVATAVADDGALDEFERRLIAGRRAPSITPRTRTRALVFAGLGAVAALGWVALTRAPHATAIVARAAVHASAQAAGVVTHAVPPVAPAAPASVAPRPVAEVPPPVAPAPAPQSAAAALESEAVLPQRTAQLTELLRNAVTARRRGERAAAEALQAWLDAGGTDAQPVAQFAYWLGRRNRLQLAAQWAERATTLDPTDQMAWYVLGAVRLEDYHQPRAAAFDALRRCAALAGRFTAECVGPLASPATLHGVTSATPRPTGSPSTAATPPGAEPAAGETTSATPESPSAAPTPPPAQH